MRQSLLVVLGALCVAVLLIAATPAAAYA